MFVGLSFFKQYFKFKVNAIYLKLAKLIQNAMSTCPQKNPMKNFYFCDYKFQVAYLCFHPHKVLNTFFRMHKN